MVRRTRGRSRRTHLIGHTVLSLTRVASSTRRQLTDGRHAHRDVLWRKAERDMPASCLADITQIDGVWMFDFNDEAMTQTERLKSKAAKRRVPLHSRLIELGLSRLPERTRRREGHDSYVPGLQLQPEARLRGPSQQVVQPDLHEEPRHKVRGACISWTTTHFHHTTRAGRCSSRTYPVHRRPRAGWHNQQSLFQRGVHSTANE
jgi:hypothetical protein